MAPDLNAVLDNIRNWIMGILALLATVFLSIGGVRYLISNGDPGEIGKAKDSFRNAGWGYGLAALAPVVVAILKRDRVIPAATWRLLARRRAVEPPAARPARSASSRPRVPRTRSPS